MPVRMMKDLDISFALGGPHWYGKAAGKRSGFGHHHLLHAIDKHYDTCDLKNVIVCVGRRMLSGATREPR